MRNIKSITGYMMSFNEDGDDLGTIEFEAVETYSIHSKRSDGAEITFQFREIDAYNNVRRIGRSEFNEIVKLVKVFGMDREAKVMANYDYDFHDAMIEALVEINDAALK